MIHMSDNQIIEIAEYMLKNNETIRNTGYVFKISKSTVFRYITEILLDIDNDLASEIRTLLDRNLSERHIRGGESTKRKLMKLHENM